MVVRDRIVKIVVKRDGKEEGEDVYRVRRVSELVLLGLHQAPNLNFDQTRDKHKRRGGVMCHVISKRRLHLLRGCQH